MTDETQGYGCGRFAADADRVLDRTKSYLGRRRAADWGFFLVGVLLGGLLF